MNHVISEHALKQMQVREITADMVYKILGDPQQIAEGKRGRKIYQGLIVKANRLMLLRVVVVTEAIPPVVVSVYATTDARYWES
jgi:hypothetical protein